MSQSFYRQGREQSPPWGIAASVAVHASFGALLLLASPQPLPLPAQLHSIAIELVPPPDSSRTPAPAAMTPAPKALPSIPSAAAAPARGKPGDGTIRATTMFASGLLKDPANSKIRRTLSHFAPGEQLVQLCNMEGLEQIRRAEPRYDPDVLVSYAMADTVTSGLTLIADGAAFHSGGAWYAMRFRCTISADHSGVEDFVFRLGSPIPKSEWASHDLPTQYKDSE